MQEDEENLVQEEISGESANPSSSSLMKPVRHDSLGEMGLFVNDSADIDEYKDCGKQRGAAVLLCCC